MLLFVRFLDGCGMRSGQRCNNVIPPFRWVNAIGNMDEFFYGHAMLLQMSLCFGQHRNDDIRLTACSIFGVLHPENERVKAGHVTKFHG